jgi:hypothetical protein
VENASHVKDANIDPWTIAWRRTSVEYGGAPCAAKNPAIPPKKVSPAPVGSATASSGHAEARNNSAPESADAEKRMAPNSPSLITTCLGPFSSNKRPALIKFDVPDKSRA